MIAAGSEDQHTTLDESKELFAAAVDPKAIWIVPGAKHQDFLAYDRFGYEKHVVQFLTDRLRGPLPTPQRLGRTEVEDLVSEYLFVSRLISVSATRS
jgi:hypothetical protein